MKNKPIPWQVWSPLLLCPPSQVTWAEYSRHLLRMGGSRVFLSGPGLEYNANFNLEPWEGYARQLEEAIRYFQRRGIAVGFWFGPTLGWEVLGSETPFPFQELIGAGGEAARGVACPLDSGFRSYLCGALQAIARSGVDMILLEDDFRLHLRAPAVPVGCFCPLHIQAFRQESGLDLTRQELVEKVLHGSPNPIRDTFLKVAGDSLLSLAAEIEQAVHAVNPTARIGPALVMTHWSSEGLEVRDLLRTLAGTTRPFARTIGAPYWSNETWETAFVTEYTRLQMFWLRGFDVDLVAEGDGFPHTRYHTPAAGLHAYEQALLACGFPGIFRYAISYAPRPEYEAGYVKNAARHQAHYQALRDFFPPEYQDWGVHPALKPNAFAARVIPDSVAESEMGWLGWYDEPLHLHILPRLGIPLGWDDEGPAFLCGDLWANYTDTELQDLLRRGVVVDAIAAIRLQQRGVDTGCRQIDPMPAPRLEWFEDPSACGSQSGQYIWLITPGNEVFYRIRPADGAKVITRLCGPDRQPVAPGVVHYQNAQGERFCILPFDLRKGWWRGKGQEMINYCRQEQLQRSLAWVNRQPLPAAAVNAPNVHVICRAAPDGSRVAVAIQNLSLDPLPSPTLRLGARIKVPSKIELLKHNARKPVFSESYRLIEDGDTRLLQLPVTIPPMGMAGIGISQL